MRIEFTLDVKRSYDVCQVSMCVHALLYVLLLGDISMYIYKQDAHYKGLLLQYTLPEILTCKAHKYERQYVSKKKWGRGRVLSTP